jgi:hypothetical protein
MKTNGINLTFANSISPKSSTQWLNLSENDRIEKIKFILSDIDIEWQEKYNIISARNNGFVIFEFIKSIPVDERAKYFLNIESYLCKKIDDSITIWIAPVGDKSSLRNLRGIEVKNI